MNDQDIIMLHLGDLVENGKVEYWPTANHKVTMERDGYNVNIGHEFFDDHIFELNQKQRNDFSRTSSHGDFVHMGQMSNELYYDLKRQGLLETDEDIRRVLNDPKFNGVKVNDWRA